MQVSAVLSGCVYYCIEVKQGQYTPAAVRETERRETGEQELNFRLPTGAGISRIFRDEQ